MTRFSTKLIAAAAFATIAGLATPMVALAAPKAAETDTSSATAPQDQTTARAVRYCIVDTPTGSHLVRRQCKTLSAWLDLGVDPRETK